MSRDCMAVEDIDTLRFRFLSLLIQQGRMTIGENMYLLGNELGLDRELVDNIVNYYHENESIEFPILGPYIRLVKDWYKTLNSQDRIRLEEGFMLTLENLSRQNTLRAIIPSDVFNALGYHAYSDTLIPMIVESLVTRQLVRKTDNNNITITNEGLTVCREINDRNRRLWEDTMRRLGVRT